MLRFYYNPSYKYTNRQVISIGQDTNYTDKDYINIDSADTINGHIIYKTNAGEVIPTYILDTDSSRRWFVSGITQLRSGKYQLSLLRDIISESPDLWQSEEAYINAGLANDYNKYKRWNLPYTNTKVKQERLNINGKSSFFVFYVNEQKVSNQGAISEEDLQINQTSVPGYTNFDFEVTSLDEIPGYDYVNAGTRINVAESNSNIYLYIYDTTLKFAHRFKFDVSSGDIVTSGPSTPAHPNGPFGSCIKIPTNNNVIKNNTNNNAFSLKTAINNFIANQTDRSTNISSAIVNNLSAYVNKIIYETNSQKFYTIRLNQTSGVSSKKYNAENAGELITALRSINWATTGGTEGTITSLNYASDGDFLTNTINYTQYEYTLQELGTATSFNFNFRADVSKLPKSAVRCVNIVASGDMLDSDLTRVLMAAQTNGTLGINQQGIDDTANVGRIIDIQYLPFSVATTTNEDIKINNTAQVAQFLDVDDFEYAVDLPDLTNINKETDTIKIVSPSRASQFLFRPYDNDGNMIFNTKITIRPYNSVIYVRPSTQGLLLLDWDDKDCLIISEDFSLTNVTSSWTEYVYNNRNYQNAFAREIQGREFERTWERRVEEAQQRADEWTARNISTQKATTYTGNLPLISDIAGAVGSAWKDSAYMQAAQVDREYNEALYQESLAISREQFSYQMDNIKSQPLIPSKVTTIDCKFLDGIYLEYYSTNQTELDAIANYYRYNGHRIDDYGTFGEYLGQFVRGKIIKSQHYTQPEIDELNKRLGAGVFTGVNND